MVSFACSTVVISKTYLPIVNYCSLLMTGSNLYLVCLTYLRTPGAVKSVRQLILCMNWTLLTYTILLPFNTLARTYKGETITGRCVTFDVSGTCCTKTLAYYICLLCIKLLSLHGFNTKLIKRTDFSHDPPPLLC